MTMLSYLIVSGLCLLLLLHIVGKVWQNALEIHSAADTLDKTRADAERGQRAANHRPTAGHTLLHEIPQVITAAISSAIAAGGPARAAGSQVSRLAQSDALARIVDSEYPAAYDAGRPTTSEKPLDGDFRIEHCAAVLKASPVEDEERVS
jgi:hypothetical protein